MNDINLETIDVKLLKKQKQGLVDLASQLTLKHDKPIVKILDGVINLLDYIQDAIQLEAVTFNLLYNSPRKDDLKFVCPECQDIHQLEQIGTVDTEITDILHIRRDGELVYGNVRTEGQNGIEEFRCAGCGWVITDEDGVNITEDEELAKWLKKQYYNKPTKPTKQRKGKQ